jgi:hypothetical protein
LDMSSILRLHCHFERECGPGRGLSMEVFRATDFECEQDTFLIQ